MELRVGEKLKVIEDFVYDGNMFVVGDEATVIRVKDDNYVTLEFLRNIGGHDADGEGKPSHCWNFWEFEDVLNRDHVQKLGLKVNNFYIRRKSDGV